MLDFLFLFCTFFKIFELSGGLWLGLLCSGALLSDKRAPEELSVSIPFPAFG